MIFLRARRRAVTLLGVTSVAAGFLLNASVATAARAATSTGGGSGSAGAPSFSVTGVNGPLPATLPTAGASSPYAVGAATALAPAAATAATAAASGDGKVAVAWVPGVAGGGLTADTWWIQTYQADGTYIGEQAAPATATSATVTGLVPGYGYLFGVLADSSGSYSAYRFSPTVTTSGYQGQPGTPLPIANPQARPASTGPPVNPVTTLTTKISLPLPVGGTPPTLPPVGTPSLPTSGAVLGKEAWQTYENTDAGSGQTASVNVANGNLVLTAQDSTQIQAHGQLAYTLRRTYNSLDASTLATSPGSIGAGWRLNLGEELGDTTGTGVLGGALNIPNPSDLSPGAVTLIDRDGTHHTFTPKTTTTSITAFSPALDALRRCGVVPSLYCNIASQLAQLQQNALLCVDRSYTAPPGVHLGVYRALALPGTDNTVCPANPAATAGAVVAGYVAVRPDRVTTVYASTGELLSMTDHAGVVMRYVYDAAPTPGRALGRLDFVYEPRSCTYTPFTPGATGPAPLPGNCRGYRLDYYLNTAQYGQIFIGGIALGALAGSSVTVTDPAGRSTEYVLSNGTVQRLIAVLNPDSSYETYAYQGSTTDTTGTSSCGGSPGQLCTVTDARNRKTNFTYTALTSTTSTGTGNSIGSVADRRGLLTTYGFTKNVETYISTGTPDGLGNVFYDGSQTRYYIYDASGRVTEFHENGGSNQYRTTNYNWDTSSQPCTQPTAVVDNDLCSVTRSQIGTDPSAPPSQTTTATYNLQGQPLVISRSLGSGSAPLVTTMGYQQEQLTLPPAGTTTPVAILDSYHDTITGNGQVTSDPNRPDNLYVLSDATAMLTPRGNQASNYPDYETAYTLDANPTAAAGSTAPRCGNGNTGLTCQVDAPNPAGGRALTSYTYDTFGQRTSMVTPKANAETPAGQTPPAMTYAYFGDTAIDLSGTTQAGGWLASVTDQAGHFVAFGYDAAGNVARTWDRNATAGHTQADFPGTLAAPSSPAYTETLHADPGPGRDLTADQEQAALQHPWRWTWSTRDQLGNRTHTAHDANGNPMRMTSPRGVQLATASSSPTTYDTTMTYDAGDLLLSMLTPAEARANGAAQDSPTVYVYDVFGNRTMTTDPDGKVTTVSYDPVDRPTVTTWSRGPYDATTAPANCRPSTPADTGFAAGLTLCSSNVAYDGLDQKIAVSDAAGTTTRMSYDAVGRMTGSTTPRNNNTIASTQTAMTYDADGHKLDVCSPREFTEGSGSCTAGSVYATHTTYNPAGTPTTVTRHRDAGTVLTSSTSYDADGNPVASTDPDANTTTTGYDLLDRPTSLTKPRSPGLAFTTLLGYDPVGNRTSVQTPDAVATTTATSMTPAGEPGYRTTAYGYDADNRLLDTVTGADNLIAASAGTASTDGGSNIRTRAVYDADGHTVATYSPRAFTASVTSPDPRFLSRTDVDPDGRPAASYAPRYDTADPAYTDPTGTPTTDCPTGASPAAVTVPASMPAVPGYPGTVGVCITRTGYDPDGQPVVRTMPTAGGVQPGQTSKQMTTAYTDDHLVASTSGPSPTGTGTAMNRLGFPAGFLLAAVTGWWTVGALSSLGQPGVS